MCGSVGGSRARIPSCGIKKNNTWMLIRHVLAIFGKREMIYLGIFSMFTGIVSIHYTRLTETPFLVKLYFGNW